MRFDNHPNRQHRLRDGNKSKFWCSKCDGALVGRIGKCRNCGKMQLKRKLKGY
jgi:hypothetical protein